MEKEIYYEGLVHEITEAKKVQKSGWCSSSPSPKAQKPKAKM
jgi:hypothetical protein